MDEHSIKQRRRKKRKIKKLIRRLVRIAIIVLLLLLLLFLGVFLKKKLDKKDKEQSQEVFNEIETIGKDDEEKDVPITASILSAGDIIMHDPLLSSNYYLKEDGTYDYNPIFTYIKDDYKTADFTVINLESTISDGNYKGYPRFRAPAAITTALAQMGTDMCLLANNHIYDNYDSGMHMTMNAVESNSMIYMGVRKSTSAKTYFVKDINGIKVGFFNYVFDTGKVGGQDKSINSIPVSNESAPLINTFNYGNLQALYDEIQSGLLEMQSAGVEYTIAYIHWGDEYQTTENQRQRQIATQLCELGIDALIGGHPHVVQPVDLLTNATGDHQMLCVYSLGNHLSNQYRERMVTTKPTGHTEDGLMVNLVLEKTDDGIVSLIDVDFIPTWVYRTPNVEDTDNPEFFIMPLDNPSQLLKNVNLPGLSNDIDESLNRTNEIISAGVEKILNALPIKTN